MAISALVELADGMNGKSEAAKLREIFDHVELALSSGVRREKVLETIRTTLGINMNLKTFEKNLYRIRKKRKSENLETETSHKSNTRIQQLNVRSDTTGDVAINISEAREKDSKVSKRFITPKDIRNMRLNTLKELDNEEHEDYIKN